MVPADLRFGWIAFEAASSRAPDPSVRATLSLEASTDASSFDAAISARLPLPATLAHPAEQRFGGSRVGGDSILGEVTSTKRVDRSIAEALAVRSTIAGLDGLHARVFHNTGGDSLLTFVAVGSRGRNYVEMSSRGFRSDHARALDFQIGGVDVDAARLRDLLGALRRDDEAGDLVALVGAGATRELLAVHARLGPTYVGPFEAWLSRHRCSNDAVARDGAPRTARVTREQHGPHYRWICALQDGSTFDFWSRAPTLCGESRRPLPPGRWGDVELRAAGGAIVWSRALTH